ncbi:hypothetical protein BpHYR1_016472, partial [Brachionus plicatilis]
FTLKKNAFLANYFIHEVGQKYPNQKNFLGNFNYINLLINSKRNKVGYELKLLKIKKIQNKIKIIKTNSFHTCEF